MKHYLKIGAILFLLTVKGYAQHCEIRHLVFEGAGIRGIAYAGVIDELELHGKLEAIEKVGGTSAGAITALMVSLGYSSTEIADLISSTEFRKFNDGRFYVCRWFCPYEQPVWLVPGRPVYRLDRSDHKKENR